MKNPNKQIVTSVNRNGNVSHSDKLGILEWFSKDDYEHVQNTIRDLSIIGISNLRTGISLSVFNTESGQKWYNWLIPSLAKHFNVLPCFSSEIEIDKSDFKNLDFTSSLTSFIDLFGDYFEYIEFSATDLLNNKDNVSQLITSLISLNKKVVLGNINTQNIHQLSALSNNVLQNLHVVGIKAYPTVYRNEWDGWQNEIEVVKDFLDLHQCNAEIWITETGYSTGKYDDSIQIQKFIDVVNLPVNKVFWYSLYDYAPEKATPEGFHLDERAYHFGMKQANGISKLLFRLLEQKPAQEIRKEDLYLNSIKNKPLRDKGILITGGAGFIGTNVADILLSQGERVIIYDNLSRPGVENNLKWLVSQHPQVEVIIADVRDKYSVQRAVNEAKHIFHFAAQVAVTSSLVLPMHDFDVNVGGTVNVLEAIRLSTHKPSLIFTSTNKVYGDLPGLELESNSTRYFPVNPVYFKNGIGENISLNFHSPYGCSKGSADQYIIDYTRSFGLRTVVFRMSCIYGPHQFGTEDQGWIAHFINQAINNKAITLYGDGKQVRDILYVDDLVNAFLLAKQNIGELAGEAFNMGGGPDNAVSLVELLDYLNSVDHLNIKTVFDEWRIGDQKYYVSDTRKFRKRTGWKPRVSYMEGLINIYSWLSQYHMSQVHEKSIVQ